MTARPYAITPLFDNHVCSSMRLFHRLCRTGRTARINAGTRATFTRELASATNSTVSTIMVQIRNLSARFHG